METKAQYEYVATSGHEILGWGARGWRLVASVWIPGRWTWAGWRPKWVAGEFKLYMEHVVHPGEESALLTPVRFGERG